MRILGLDVSKSSVSACLLTEKPDLPRQFYYEANFWKIEATSEGIAKLLALNSDVAILEPTGVNYSKFWRVHLERAGVEVRQVGHKELRSYRQHHLGLPDKDDDADSLALACYYFDYSTDPKRFVQPRDETIIRVRELVLRLAHLNRIQSPIINRLRQDLAWQFPEIALRRGYRATESETVPILWAWLANERKSTKYDQLYAESIGLGVNDSSRRHALRLCEIHREEISIESELKKLLKDSRFIPYRQVFKIFAFGLRLECIILSQIFPIENFMLDGKPEVQIRKGRNSKKPTKRYLSLRRFQKALGLAPSLEQSGDTKKVRMRGGSDLCRKSLWQWVFTRIEPQRSRLKNEVGKVLSKQLDDEKTSGRPIKLVRMRVAAHAVRLLFKQLTAPNLNV
ncbi:IS110 family transposase [Nostoc sp.]|uniref:IS110 family transposase n=1 Tax=Nostoc sp. TaxID=1180 RepID=UPI002FFB76DD